MSWSAFGTGVSPPPVESNLAILRALGKWNGEAGFEAVVNAWDHGEPGPGDPLLDQADRYAADILDSDGLLVYRIDAPIINRGNIQLMPLRSHHH